jgi:heat shock protein HspQ
MTQVVAARFALGQVVRHRDGAFCGVIIDVDPRFAGKPDQTGEISPDQPFYEVLALGQSGGFVAYAPEDALEQALHVPGLSRAQERRYFTTDARGRHAPKDRAIH